MPGEGNPHHSPLQIEGVWHRHDFADDDDDGAFVVQIYRSTYSGSTFSVHVYTVFDNKPENS